MKRLSLSVVKRKLIEEKAGGIIPQADDSIANELKKDRGIKVDSKMTEPKAPTPKQGNFPNTKAKITKFTPVSAGKGDKSSGGNSPPKLAGGTAVKGTGSAQKGPGYGNKPSFSQVKQPAMKDPTAGTGEGKQARASGNNKSPIPDATSLRGSRGFMGKDHIKPTPTMYNSPQEDPDTRGSNNTRKPTWDRKGIHTYTPNPGEPRISNIEGGHSVVKTGGIPRKIDQKPRQEKVAWPNMTVGGSSSPEGGSTKNSPVVDGKGGSGGSGSNSLPNKDHGNPRSKPQTNKVGESRRTTASRILREFFEDEIASDFMQKVNDGVAGEEDLKSFASDKAREMSQDPGEQHKIFKSIVRKYHEMAGGKPDEGEDMDAGPGEELHDEPVSDDRPDRMEREHVMDGVLEVRVGGRRKMAFEAAIPSVLTKIVDGYEQAGQRVSIMVRGQRKPSHSDPRLQKLMMESIHARKNGLEKLGTKKLRAAFVQFKGLIESEYSPFYFQAKSEWLHKVAVPAFDHAINVFERTYDSRLKPMDVVVRADTGRGVEDFDVMTEAFDNEMAVSNAVAEVKATAGLDARIVHAFVDGRKYLGEELEKSPFSKLPSFFSDMPSPPGKLVQGKGEGGDVAKDPKVEKSKKLGDGRGKYDGYGGMKTSDVFNTGSGGGSKAGKVPDSLIDKVGKVPTESKPPKEATSDLDTEDKGPIYSESRLGSSFGTSQSSFSASDPRSVMDPKVCKLISTLRDDAAKTQDDKLSNFLARLSDQLENNQKLGRSDALALDKYLTWKQRRSQPQQQPAARPQPQRESRAMKKVQRDSRGLISTILREDGSVMARIERDGNGMILGIVEV